MNRAHRAWIAGTLSLSLFLPSVAVSGQEPSGPELQEALDSGRIALGARGVSAAVIFPDGSIWTGVSGEAYDGMPVEPATLFEIGSVTKTFTAALVVGLAADGVLSLDDPVREWVEDSPAPPGATLRHLLQHTSGLADAATDSTYIPSMIANPVRVWDPRETFPYLGGPVGEPGEAFHYSSTGYLLAGLAVEAAAESPFAELLRERVLDPLGMERTVFGATEPPSPPEAHPFIDLDGDGSPEDLRRLIPSTAFLTSAGAAGALLSTADDLARGLRGIHTGALLGPEAYRTMTTFVDRPDGRSYGLGVLRDERLDGVRLGHEGNSAGFGAAAWHLPDEGITVAVLANVHLTRLEPIVAALLEAVRD